MIALRYLEMKPIKDFFSTPKKIREARARLDEATEYELKQCNERNREAYQRAKYIVLD